MAPPHSLAGLLAVSTVVLAAAGAALVFTHTAGALGLFLLAAGAADAIVAWLALGAPRTRSEIEPLVGCLATFDRK